MDLQDAVNALYVKALAAKRYLDRDSTRLQLEQIDTSRLTCEVLNLVQTATSLLAEVHRLTDGLNRLTLGELKLLSVQLKIEPVASSKDDLIKWLLLKRRESRDFPKSAKK
jgi:hypothetical protein